MGYQRPLIKLTFDDTMGDMAGFEITLRRMSIDDMFVLTQFSDMEGGMSDPENIQIFSQALDILAKYAIMWNLEDHTGKHIIMDRETIGEQDPMFLIVIIKMWLVNAMSIPVPLAQPSKDGEQFPEGSIPMTDIPLPSPSN